MGSSSFSPAPRLLHPLTGYCWRVSVSSAKVEGPGRIPPLKTVEGGSPVGHRALVDCRKDVGRLRTDRRLSGSMAGGSIQTQSFRPMDVAGIGGLSDQDLRSSGVMKPRHLLRVVREGLMGNMRCEESCWPLWARWIGLIGARCSRPFAPRGRTAPPSRRRYARCSLHLQQSDFPFRVSAHTRHQCLCIPGPVDATFVFFSQLSLDHLRGPKYITYSSTNTATQTVLVLSGYVDGLLFRGWVLIRSRTALTPTVRFVAAMHSVPYLVFHEHSQATSESGLRAVSLYIYVYSQY
ncbi:hypothetical protein OF83DRAFT_809474 [Amylostereum chailletii]|nr:hypothetical protein OF83DRAFT_809474 [Amylostereum chailletii]